MRIASEAKFSTYYAGQPTNASGCISSGGNSTGLMVIASELLNMICWVDSSVIFVLVIFFKVPFASAWSVFGPLLCHNILKTLFCLARGRCEKEVATHS
jgi:hypothetical protein